MNNFLQSKWHYHVLFLDGPAGGCDHQPTIHSFWPHRAGCWCELSWQGQTALHMAAKYSYSEVFQVQHWPHYRHTTSSLTHTDITTDTVPHHWLTLTSSQTQNLITDSLVPHHRHISTAFITVMTAFITVVKTFSNPLRASGQSKVA